MNMYTLVDDQGTVLGRMHLEDNVVARLHEMKPYEALSLVLTAPEARFLCDGRRPQQDTVQIHKLNLYTRDKDWLYSVGRERRLLTVTAEPTPVALYAIALDAEVRARKWAEYGMFNSGEEWVAAEEAYDKAVEVRKAAYAVLCPQAPVAPQATVEETPMLDENIGPSHLLFMDHSGPMLRYELPRPDLEEEYGNLHINDLNPEMHVAWRMTRWEMFKLGLKCLRASLGFVALVLALVLSQAPPAAAQQGYYTDIPMRPRFKGETVIEKTPPPPRRGTDIPMTQRRDRYEREWRDRPDPNRANPQYLPHGYQRGNALY